MDVGRLTPDERDQRFMRRLFYVALAIALIVFLHKAQNFLLLAFGAMLGAVVLSTVANWLDAKLPIGRGLCLTIAFLGVLAALGLMGWLFGDAVSDQVESLSSRLPEDWQRVEAALSASGPGRLLLESGKQIGNSPQVARFLAGASWGAIEIVVNFVIILIAALFFAAQPDLYRHGIALLAPARYRPAVADAVEDVGRSLRLWLLTQVASMTIMGVLIGLGLWWSGLDEPAALGLLGGLSEFIPYVGPTLAMIPAIIVALAGHGSIWGVLITYALVRMVQANLITPLISQRVVSVPPGLYLFLILASGAAFGTFGLFFSGALAVTAYTLVIRLYVRETLGEDVALPGEG